MRPWASCREALIQSSITLLIHLMKTKSTILAATLAAALASTASAQILPNPTGVNMFNNPLFASNVTNYANAFGNPVLSPNGNLYIDSGANTTPPAIAGWNNAPAPLPVFSATGGSVKVIFLGETAGNLNDFGYVKSTSITSTYINNPANLKYLATDIENGLTGGGNVVSGQEAYVHYGAGESIDFFLYNSGSPFTNGGLGAWFTFGQGGLEAYLHGGALPGYQHYRWTTQQVMTEYVNASGAFVTGLVDTLLVSFEDFTFAPTSPGDVPPIAIPGADYSDFIFAFQFLPNQAVPEPSTYGLMGAAALLGLVGYRRFKASKKAA
jgi:hypothetical protein